MSGATRRSVSSGLPAGGTIGQALTKKTNADGDTQWSDTAALSNATPLAASGSGSAGTSAAAARADHVHPASSGVLLPSGLWVPAVMSNNSSVTLTKDREHILSFDLAPQTIDQIAIRVANVPDAGSVLRVGFRADSSGAPGNTVPWQQAIAVDGGVGFKASSAGIGYVHPGGLLHIAYASQNWTTTGPQIGGNTPYFANFFRWGWSLIGLAATWYATTTNFSIGSTYVGVVQNGVSGALGAFTPLAGFQQQQAIEIMIKRA